MTSFLTNTKLNNHQFSQKDEIKVQHFYSSVTEESLLFLEYLVINPI